MPLVWHPKDYHKSDPAGVEAFSKEGSHIIDFLRKVDYQNSLLYAVVRASSLSGSLTAMAAEIVRPC
jgi:hypothetical protein